MFCYRCGSKLEDGDKFCPQCGTKVEECVAETQDIPQDNTGEGSCEGQTFTAQNIQCPPQPQANLSSTSAQTRKNGFALWSFGLGIASLTLLSEIFVPAICAIVFGILGVIKAKKIGKYHLALAVAGIVMGALAIFSGISFWVDYASGEYDTSIWYLFWDLMFINFYNIK